MVCRSWVGTPRKASRNLPMTFLMFLCISRVCRSAPFLVGNSPPKGCCPSHSSSLPHAANRPHITHQLFSRTSAMHYHQPQPADQHCFTSGGFSPYCTVHSLIGCLYGRNCHVHSSSEFSSLPCLLSSHVLRLISLSWPFWIQYHSR